AMFGDGILSLIESGAVTNRKKTFMPGKTIATFALGSRRLYRTLHRNPAIEMHPVDFTNDPYIAARNDNLCAINATLQIDLLGQCGSESLGHLPYSGTGGQVDFVRAANRSKGGKAFIVLPSTAKDGAVSRIAPVLSPGTHVTTSKNGINYVVTQFGVAELRGKTAKQRAEALIGIAHPDFRAQLRESARKMNLLWHRPAGALRPRARQPQRSENDRDLLAAHEFCTEGERIELERVARSHDAHRRLGGIHHGNVADAVFVHEVKRVAEGLVFGERHRVVRHHLAHRRGVGIEAGGDHAEGGVALGEDAGEHAVLGDQGGAAMLRLHELGHFPHRGEDRHVDEGTVGKNLMDRTAGHDLSPFAFIERHGFSSLNRASLPGVLMNAASDRQATVL